MIKGERGKESRAVHTGIEVLAECVWMCVWIVSKLALVLVGARVS